MPNLHVSPDWAGRIAQWILSCRHRLRRVARDGERRHDGLRWLRPGIPWRLGDRGHRLDDSVLGGSDSRADRGVALVIGRTKGVHR